MKEEPSLKAYKYNVIQDAESRLSWYLDLKEETCCEKFKYYSQLAHRAPGSEKQRLNYWKLEKEWSRKSLQERIESGWYAGLK